METKEILLDDAAFIRKCDSYNNNGFYINGHYCGVIGIEYIYNRRFEWVKRAEKKFIEQHKREILNLAAEMCESYVECQIK